MRYMVIETFAPDGLFYIDSWLEKDGDTCYQLMETDSPELFERWIEQWKDLVSFKVIELEPRKG